jgi:hypothetical protein
LSVPGSISPSCPYRVPHLLLVRSRFHVSSNPHISFLAVSSFHLSSNSHISFLIVSPSLVSPDPHISLFSVSLSLFGHPLVTFASLFSSRQSPLFPFHCSLFSLLFCLLFCLLFAAVVSDG